MAERNRPLFDRRPDPAVDWFQAEPVLTRCLDLDRLVRKCWRLPGPRGAMPAPHTACIQGGAKLQQRPEHRI